MAGPEKSLRQSRTFRSTRHGSTSMRRKIGGMPGRGHFSCLCRYRDPINVQRDSGKPLMKLCVLCDHADSLSEERASGAKRGFGVDLHCSWTAPGRRVAEQGFLRKAGGQENPESDMRARCRSSVQATAGGCVRKKSRLRQGKLACEVKERRHGPQTGVRSSHQGEKSELRCIALQRGDSTGRV